MSDFTCPRLLADADGLLCRDKRQPERIDATACDLCHWRRQKPKAGLRASPDGSLPEVLPVISVPPGSRRKVKVKVKPVEPRKKCTHLGPELRIVKNTLCGCGATGDMPVFQCALHGECTQNQCRERGKGKYHACSTCADYDKNPFPDITFGITAFERPRHLEKLVASIRRLYPDARILVVDNGSHQGRLPADVEVVKLEFNCGLSAARNALIDRLKTKYLFLLEDDFEFTAESRVELLIDVLEHHPEVGCVGGSLYNNGNLQDYAVDMHLFQGALHGVRSNGHVRVTDKGTPYRLCDKIYNFGLWRREMLADHRWPEEIKLQEHTSYFWRAKQAGKWLVAHCGLVRANHDQSGRDQRYRHYRNNVSEYRRLWYESDGISGFHQPASLNNGYRQPARPNILVMGVGHSRTSVLARMLKSLGMSLLDADERFAESVDVRRRNHELLVDGRPWDVASASGLLASLPSPWVIKDPRFVLTLDRWLPALSSIDHPPLLIWITRDAADLESSYLRRRLLVDGNLTLDYQRGWTLPKLHAEAQRQYDLYPWPKITISDRQLAEMAAQFEQPTGLQIIPRMFHRVWLGGKPMPQEYMDFGTGWLKLNPGWEMREWSESDLPELITGELIKEARNYSQASDILRYELLYRFGGVYLDTDFEAFKPIEPWLRGYSWVGAGEHADMVSAGLIACTSQHPITAAVLEFLPERIRSDLPQATATGPGMLTKIWRRFKDQPGVHAYGPELFYPYGFKEKHRRHERFPNAVAAHHWAGSWLGE